MPYDEKSIKEVGLQGSWRPGSSMIGSQKWENQRIDQFQTNLGTAGPGSPWYSPHQRTKARVGTREGLPFSMSWPIVIG